MDTMMIKGRKWHYDVNLDEVLAMPGNIKFTVCRHSIGSPGCTETQVLYNGKREKRAIASAMRKIKLSGDRISVYVELWHDDRLNVFDISDFF